MNFVSIPHRYRQQIVKGGFFMASYMFQFLIGTVQPTVLLGCKQRVHFVSIPHRYSTTGYTSNVLYFKSDGFNSS